MFQKEKGSARGAQGQLGLRPRFTDGSAEAREGGGSRLKAALPDWPPAGARSRAGRVPPWPAQLDSLESLGLDSTPCSGRPAPRGPGLGARFPRASRASGPCPALAASRVSVPDTRAEVLLCARRRDASLSGTDLPLHPCNRPAAE